jgi:hypothetical protein
VNAFFAECISGMSENRNHTVNNGAGIPAVASKDVPRLRQ